MNQNKMQRVSQTLLEMLEDRGLNVDKLRAVAHAASCTPEHPKWHGMEIDGRVRLFYFTGPTLVKNHSNALGASASDGDGAAAVVKHHIIVVQDKLPPMTANTVAGNYSAAGYTLEVFEAAELLFNISRHQLVPKHEVLSKAEAEAVMKLYDLNSRTQLPLILRSDPMARYLGVKPGQVVRITSASPTAAEYVSYRACV